MKENQYDKNYKFEKIDRELVSGGPKIEKLDSMSFQSIVVILAKKFKLCTTVRCQIYN